MSAAYRDLGGGPVALTEAAAALVHRVRREKGLLRAALLRFVLSQVRALAGTRKYPKFCAVRLTALTREVLGAILAWTWWRRDTGEGGAL